MTKLARAKRLSLWLLLFFQFPKFTMNLGIVIANFIYNLGIVIANFIYNLGIVIANFTMNLGIWLV